MLGLKRICLTLASGILISACAGGPAPVVNAAAPEAAIRPASTNAAPSAGDAPSAGALLGGGTLELQVGGVADVPGDAKAVVLNVTATNTTGPGFLTVWPCGEPRP